jgi:YidC/Oxa1 family membrane protein insertase
MDKKVILAIGISLGIWIAWTLIFQPNKPVPQNPVVTETKTVETVKTETAPAAAKPAVELISRNKVNTETKTTITTGVYSIVFSNRGARMESVTYGERKIELVAGKEKHPVTGYLDFPLYTSRDELLKGSALDKELWELRSATVTTVSYAAALMIAGKPAELVKTYTFNEKGYYFDLSYRITNLAKDAMDIPAGTLRIVTPDFLGPVLKNYEGNYNAPSSVYVEADSDSLDKGTKGGGFFSKTVDVGEAKKVKWAGVMSRFFTLALLPQNFTAEAAEWDGRKETKTFRTALVLGAETIAAGASTEKNVKVALAEKNKEILASVDASLKPGADVNKWIEPIRFGVMWLLLWINKFIGNFGVSIIILSVITKAIFLPLTQKSTESMKKMSELSPKINALKEKYKDKPEELQKATMELYKTAGVNPLGGCLPLIVQMPFFFALYSALSSSIDTLNAPFLFWIQDLSMPDTVAQVMGVNINILPILMTATTYVQQKFTTVDTGNQSQKIMMMMMPLLFIWIFWSMPSGLVLYWTVQNLLQIAHQFYVMKKPKKA